MRTIELGYSEADPQPVLEQFCRTRSLNLSPRMQLATYPGCSHWHLSKPGDRGTLEVTWWPKGRRFWLKVAGNREGGWVEEACDKLRETP